MPTPRFLHLLGPALLLTATGCLSPGDRARLSKDNENLRRTKEKLERAVLQRDASVALLTRQVEDLTTLGPNRPVGTFAAMRLEIADLSGGSDFDGRPGDDGVTVYLRPLDADGDVVKAPGRIRIELLDGSNLGSPRVLGIYQFDDLEQLRKMWHAKFLTQHYTLRCPFPPNTAPPASRSVLVRIEFLEYLTGATLTATKEVRLSVPAG